MSEIAAESGKIVPCTYMGRLLLSARTERLPKDSELLAAHSVAAAPYEEPRIIPILLFADVYEVGIGRVHCFTELCEKLPRVGL